MSEKVIDLNDMIKTIKHTVIGEDRRMIEDRLRTEAEHQALEDEAEALQASRKSNSPVDAQLVFSPEKGAVGVAVRGARRVCMLPKGYDGRGLELALMNEKVIVAICPGKSPLILDTDNGTTRRL